MPYYPPEVVAEAKAIDLLTYLKRCDPNELIQLSEHAYCTRTHDSLKISNGKWCWFSRGIGGRSALDYLVKVKEIPFTDAVGMIVGRDLAPAFQPQPAKPEKKVLLLPEASHSPVRAYDYLLSRGIDGEILDDCLAEGRFYESRGKYSNVVFVGYDRDGQARSASIRGIGTDFKGECNGSDKQFSFNIPAPGSNTLHLFESAIDLLSYATLRKLHGLDWKKDHLLSLAGVYQPRKDGGGVLPMALTQYLKDYPEIQQIVLRLDNDYAGRTAAGFIGGLLSAKYTTIAKFPTKGKDYNDYLCSILGQPLPKYKEQIQAR